MPSGHLLRYVLFQSTLSMRRATGVPTFNKSLAVISIHALHEESDYRLTAGGMVDAISIHALHEESDYRSNGIQSCS